MRRRRSTLTDTLTIHAGDDHRQIQPGDVVDFDDAIAGGTLEAALGPHAAAFVTATDSADPDPGTKPPSRRRVRGDKD